MTDSSSEKPTSTGPMNDEPSPKGARGATTHDTSMTSGDDARGATTHDNSMTSGDDARRSPPPAVSPKSPGGWRAVVEGRTFFLVAVLLPLVGYLGSIGLAEARRAGAPRVRVAIEGYDPRDPLRGHYLLFRLTTEPSPSESVLPPAHREPWETPVNQMGYEHKACLGAPENGITPIYRYEGSRPDVCTQDFSDEFARESHRYYVQQDQALDLEEAVRDGKATVTLVLPPSSAPSVEGLQIDGKPWP